jgi:two-component system CheB/CheR fusion protein
MQGGKATGKTKPQASVTPPSDSDLPASTPDTPFPIVGIGASAGGLAAFEAFFSGMPADSDPGMAFVLVQHLAPDHKSILPDLIQRYTRLQVIEVTDGVEVRPNCIYVIPPSRQMAFLHGRLELLEPSEPRGQRLPIDFFFRSLAQNQHEYAIGVVLAGTGSDGTLGVRAIKAEGGMVMAQEPGSTTFDGMPRSAIATGLVDWQLPPAEMPAQIISYATHAFGRLAPLLAEPAPKTQHVLKKIFVLVRAQTGHDFSQYKMSSIHRRILRRMSLHQIEALDGYVLYLQKTPQEIEALFADLLIGVTSFFRDPEAFKVLAGQIIPQLLANKPDGEVVRVWAPGCSTGEEAYSIAILLLEQMEALERRYAVQLFATDIDARAMATARAGRYPASIASDVSPERLARFFTREPDGSAYVINKSVRDLLIFSEQDVCQDPPFSRLDLISCRNLLIYFGPELQQKVIPLFHYALNPDGVLFLGTSESIGNFTDLFAVVDSKAKLYRRKEGFTGAARPGLGWFLPSRPARYRSAARAAFPMKVPLREVTEQAILQHVAPTCVLVNAQGDILYLHGRCGAYLEPQPGESGVNNVIKMARQGLQHELSKGLHQASCSKAAVRAPGLQVRTNGDFTRVNLSIHPLTTGPAATPQAPLYLLLFVDAAAADPEAPPQAALPIGAGAGHADAAGEHSEADSDARIAAIEEELRAKDEYLQSMQEELETANEELRSSNEEMQSVNEELQSTNEELETSKEELQSLNEELATVNSELQVKVGDLSQANNDMNNLLAGTGIATVFVDVQLRILRFTPAASSIINLIPSDIGRPVAHIVANLVGYDRLVSDVQTVIDTLTLQDAKVQTVDGLWYLMRIRPYRTLDNVIGGAVITFVDITEMKRLEDSLIQANAQLRRLAVVVHDASDAITVQDLEGRILSWNPAAVKMYGWTEAEALQMNVRERIPAELREEALTRIRRLSRAEVLEPHRTQRLTRDGALLDVWITVTALVDEGGQMYAVATSERANKTAVGCSEE